MKVKAVIFDFDGLMVDTERIWQNYFIRANKVFNLNFTEEDRIKIIGKNEESIRKELKNLIPSLDVDSYRDWIRTNVYNHINTQGVDTKYGLIELLDYLKQNNVLCGIASGTESSRVKSILVKNNINVDMFKVIIGGDYKLPAKPEPDVYLMACKELGILPEEVIVLEDSFNGVIAGHKAGCFTIMIPDTMKPNENIKKTANLIVDNLLDVIEVLKQI